MTKKKLIILNLRTEVFHVFTNFSRPGHSGSQSDFGFVQSGFGFSGLSKSAPFGLYKNSVRDRFGFYRVRIGVSKSSKNRYNPVYFRVLGSIRFFGFKVLDLYLFCNQNISKIGSSGFKYLICTYFVTKT